ncbi:D-glycerate 3-kinase [Luteimonas cucumeris]|uniref:D-glycerate 3-kinase n=1 Tax=Luteimonas cucumeris TaxID=985012 RepID=A0A562KY53_9GAMM|nr:kinase [Luteimonas cucumeris]TWI00352.1 D-glycerate 3-kinase [Luteimonas cucumeris]
MAPHAHPAGFAPAFVAAVLDDALSHDSRVHGITGLQGSGKSTLSAQVAALARSRGIQVAVLSIDDVYVTRSERLQLARDVHPLLATRGPPGTHDVALACELVDALRAGKACRLPRFDKLGDDRLPASQWPVVPGSDPGQRLLIIEGWFLKTPPQMDEALATPVNALEREEDRDGRWRRHCNTALARDYPALWQRIDRLLLLHGPGFDVVPDWRWQQECALQAADPARPAMNRVQVERFVQHFERVGRQAWRTLPAIAEWTVALDAQRRPQS